MLFLKGKIMNLKNKLLISYLLLISIACLIIYFFSRSSPQAEVAISTLNELQRRIVDLIIEMDKLMISLSLLIVGTTGAFLLQKYRGIEIQSLIQKIIVLSTIIFAVIAVYSGYMLYSNMIEMLSNNMFDSSSTVWS